MRALTLLTFVVAASIWMGCSSQDHRVRQARQAFDQGELAHADELLEQRKTEDDYDRDVAALDQAIVKLFSGDTRAAESILREARDRMDYLEQTSLAEGAASFLSDDLQRAYFGEDHERVMVRVMLALSNLMGDGRDVVPYMYQVNEKQQAIIAQGVDRQGENPKLNYRMVAIAPYLEGIVREESHRDYDLVERAFGHVVEWQPQFRYGAGNLIRAKEGRHSERGQGVCHVIAFVGKGPYKREAAEVPTQVALLIADQIFSALGDYSVPPTIAPVKVPQIVVPANAVKNIFVNVDGQQAGVTDTVTDVGALAIEQHKAVYSQIIARAVVRRVVKKSVVYAGKDMLDIENPLASVALDLVGVAWEATERVDLRCWGLLPSQIQVVRIPLPVGRHRLTLRPGNTMGPRSSGETVEIDIVDGRNTYVMANFPTHQIAGRILVK